MKLKISSNNFTVDYLLEMIMGSLDYARWTQYLMYTSVYRKVNLTWDKAKINLETLENINSFL